MDSINAGFLGLERVQRWAEDLSWTGAQAGLAESVLSTIRERKAEARFSKRIGTFIRSCSLVPRSNQLSEKTNRYRYTLLVDQEIRMEADFYKKLSQDLVFDHTHLHQLERKGQVIIQGIFEAFAESYFGAQGLRLLPESFDRIVRSKTSTEARARVLCDYIAGMTDVFAIRTYKRLFDPEFGSILDLS
ncbi:MAG: hypothetical protein JO076_02025 [Verrucomicrobia bacterium]|nr:hypothetical protein [Verrucomicrobiota bacterium]